jgi:septum formation protein
MLVLAGFRQALPESQTSTMKTASVTGSGPKLVLASTSPYRRQLLERFGIRFTVAAPDVDETPLPGESAIDLTNRLARAKAEVVAHRHPASVVIGSDQVALFGRDVIGKPGNPERCIEQLKTLSGERLAFHTAVNVIHSDTGSNQSHLDITTVYFRKLTKEEIERYVARERPVNCAGGFKAEALGIALFDRIESQDPTALIGLPLIWLANALRRTGFALP